MKPHKSEERTPGAAKARGEHFLGLEAAASWQVFECLVSTWWRDPSQLTEIIVAKEPPFGGVVICVFLVDLGCLGPKQGFVSQFRTEQLYRTEFREQMTARNPMMSAPYPLAAKILRESLRYAEGLGFMPSAGVQKALSALGSLRVAYECQETIPLGGPDGKPSYIAGPDDETEHILATLTRNCGPGNFHFTVPFSPLPPGFFD